MNDLIDRPEPAPVRVTEDAEALLSCEKSARALGCMSSDLLERLIPIFLQENRIGVFDYDAVDRYLEALAHQPVTNSYGEHTNSYVWVWRPLRKRDTVGGPLLGRGVQSAYGSGWFIIPSQGHGSYAKQQGYEVYGKMISKQSLDQALAIENRFPDDGLRFFVNGFKPFDGWRVFEKPEAFIMVTAPGVSRFIFGFWNEPSLARETATEASEMDQSDAIAGRGSRVL